MKYLCEHTIKWKPIDTVVLLFTLSIAIARCTTPDPDAQFDVPILDPVGSLWDVIPGLSPDYLRNDTNVVLFQCGRYSPSLLDDRVTDGTNSLHLYRSPCWVL